MDPTWAPSVNVSDEERQGYLDLLQEETTRMMIAAMVFLILLALVGFLGNSLVLIVYSRHFKQTSTRIFIMAIAVFDLVTNALAIPGEIYDMFHRWDFNQPYLCGFRLTLTNFTIVTSAFLLVAVAVTRYKKICRPYGSQTSIRNAKTTSVGITVLALLCAVPCFILNGRQTKRTPRKDIQGQACTIDDRYNHTAWPQAYMGTFIAGFVICSTSLIILYVLIGLQAWRHSGINRLGSSGSGGGGGGSGRGGRRPTFSSVTNNSFSETTHCDKDTEAHLLKKCTGQRILHFFRRHNRKGNTQGDYVDIGKCKYPEAKTETTLDRLSDTSETVKNECIVDSFHTSGYDVQLSSLKPSQIIANRTQVGSTDHTQKMSEPQTLLVSPNEDLSSCVQSDGTVWEKADRPNLDKTDGSNKDTETYQSRKSSLNSADPAPIDKTGRKAGKAKLSVAISAPNDVYNKEQTNRNYRRPMTRTTIMLFAISAVYVIGFLIHLSLIILRYSSPRVFGTMTFTGFVFYNLFLRFHFLNSASNAIIYSLCDKKFREHAWKILKCYGKTY